VLRYYRSILYVTQESVSGHTLHLNVQCSNIEIITIVASYTRKNITSLLLSVLLWVCSNNTDSNKLVLI